MFRPATALSEDGVEMTFAVNHLRALPHRKRPHASSTQGGGRQGGPRRHRLFRRPLSVPLSRRGGWLAVAFSSAHGHAQSFAQAYFDSKLANAMRPRKIQRRFTGEGVTANFLHPGGIRATGIWEH